MATVVDASGLAITEFDSYTLGRIFTRIKTPSYFFTQFFTNSINFDTDKIVFERVFRNEKGLGAFVAPNVQASYNRLSGSKLESVSAPYIKEKDLIDVNMPFVRRPGEQLFSGSMTPEQRRQALTVELLDRQKTKIYNRIEWLAAQAAIHGRVTIESDKHPRAVLDFGRNPGLTKVSNWADSNANAFKDIKDMRRLSNRLTGSKITNLYFGAKAFDAFFALHKKDLESLMDTRIRGSDTLVSRMVDQFEDTMEYVGEVSGLNGAGRFRIFIYSGTYVDEDENGNMQTRYFLDEGSVWGCAPELFEGFRCFAAIRDGSAAFKPVEVFSKNWIRNEDVWEDNLLSQSAPLMVPGRPDASFLLKVI